MVVGGGGWWRMVAGGGGLKTSWKVFWLQSENFPWFFFVSGKKMKFIDFILSISKMYYFLQKKFFIFVCRLFVPWEVLLTNWTSVTLPSESMWTFRIKPWIFDLLPLNWQFGSFCWKIGVALRPALRPLGAPLRSAALQYSGFWPNFLSYCSQYSLHVSSSWFPSTMSCNFLEM